MIVPRGPGEPVRRQVLEPVQDCRGSRLHRLSLRLCQSAGRRRKHWPQEPLRACSTQSPIYRCSCTPACFSYSSGLPSISGFTSRAGSTRPVAHGRFPMIPPDAGVTSRSRRPGATRIQREFLLVTRGFPSRTVCTNMPGSLPDPNPRGFFQPRLHLPPAP